MSALRAISLPTQPIPPAAETEAFPHAFATPGIPTWALAVEETIRVVARFGYSPTPTILLVSIFLVTLPLHAR